MTFDPLAYFRALNQQPARKAQKRATDAAYRASHKSERNAYKQAHRKAKRDTRPFVSIDSEGYSFGPETIDDNGRRFRAHKTFLWWAGSLDRREHCLRSVDTLGSVAIFEFLLSLPALFGDSIFIAFSMSYDITQALSDLPYEKVWEIHKQRPFDEDDANDPQTDAKAQLRRTVFWNGYGICYLKSKSFTLYKLNNPYHPYKTVGKSRKIDASATIKIFDVFGFFQSSFIKASESFPGAIEPDEMPLIAAGKQSRANFHPSQIEDIIPYTRCECVVLSRMMTLMREALNEQGLRLMNWFGAGSIAAALMKKYNVREHFGDVRTRDLSAMQNAAHHAYFGGRIELISQGLTISELHGYDIASAYPFIARDLPSMRGGKWHFHDANISTKLASFSVVSMVRVRTRCDYHGSKSPPFYPFPYRLPSGAIQFPPEVHGWYMADEVRAALDWQKALRPRGWSIQLIEAWEFVVLDDARPFAFLQELFDYRVSLPKSSVMQIIIKLGINSVYGKLAQAVGSGTEDKPPSTACPWFAAAITAGTRAMALRAAIRSPRDIVFFATDGVVSSSPLPLEIPATKRLGAWEYGRMATGGVFVQSGVYAISDDAGVYQTKSRGVRPTNLGSATFADVLLREIPAAWARGDKEFCYAYRTYITIGGAIAARKSFVNIGKWCDGFRAIALDSGGAKRRVNPSPRRARELISTTPAGSNMMLVDESGEMLLSAPRMPDWVSIESRAVNDEEHEANSKFGED